ncbi:hypothetical protein, conserved [Trypanosoma cruzi]|uniref:Uncharacterized protein n=1 Tax=Trypanosoma cruzi (strain CL Brener) TaxID=353153 RepID=Q4CME0_TRYCC|nr:hypothetical protein, conserved [Trypanosoma cruzi]EAN81442.1 hypothetical protein, conserved [Trypanosoma cruzi]|eukprot:XP_802888.1 hypothetical protein [Trypanosoma cruzi strain CL Brener]
MHRRGHATQSVAGGQFKRTRREGPIHIPVTRGHASTNCAHNGGDRSTCDSDTVADERVARCRDRAQTQSQEYRSTADPRGRRHGAAMPRSITGLGSRGHQGVSHGPPAARRSYRGGHDCVPPVCGELQLRASCLLVRLLARCMLAPKQTRHAPFRPYRFLWECHGCRLYGASVRLQPCDYSGQRCSKRRGGSIPVSFTQGKGSMFRRGSKPASRGMPSSVPAVDSRGWSDSM